MKIEWVVGLFVDSTSAVGKPQWAEPVHQHFVVAGHTVESTRIGRGGGDGDAGDSERPSRSGYAEAQTGLVAVEIEEFVEGIVEAGFETKFRFEKIRKIMNKM
jgi:hypothetical protein